MCSKMHEYKSLDDLIEINQNIFETYIQVIKLAAKKSKDQK